ncbi:MAG: flagellar protein FlaG [Firmicutes bacterium]|nr:flagellar protein FlaG [Bacillota bacterium]HXL04336.1 flagellar protein FlaG [Bacillota bacterium]
MEYTLAAVNLKSMNMFTRLYEGVYGQIPEINADDIDSSNHTCAEKPWETMQPVEEQTDETENEKGCAVSISNIRIAFSIDDKSGRISIKVIDNLTDEVIRHVPPEDLMSVISWLCEFQEIIAGLVIDEMR